MQQSPAHGLKFCGARARVATVILAHAASRVTFHGYLEATFSKQYSTNFKQYSTNFFKSKGFFISRQFPTYHRYTLL